MSRNRWVLGIGTWIACFALGAACGNGEPPAAENPDGGATTDEGGAADAGADVGPNVAPLVNTLLGTNASGNVFPGPDFPFGMIQWSPDTSPDRPQGGGYQYTDTLFRGFALTHISGPGCLAFGDVPILPMTGGLPAGNPAVHMEALSHEGESGTAGYYTVRTGSPAIKTELTATLRSSMARFTYPATSNANILIKLLDSQAGSSTSTAQIVGTNEVRGSTTGGHFCGAGDRYTVYFDIVFDQPFTASKIVNDGAGSLPSVVFLTFDTTTTQTLQAKVGVSFVRADNARGNWMADNPGWDFDGVRATAQSAWNEILGRIQIDGGTAAEQQMFYTSLYHALLHPNVFSDSSGEYMGFDNQVHKVSGGQAAQYANYSGWDIYHAQAQLSALLAPQQMSDSARSMLNDAAQNGGRLPKWALANGETYVMVGDPADGIIADYYAFGARNFDTAAALQAMLKEATQPSAIRPGLDYYTTLGYLPEDGTYSCCNFYGSVSTLLEYGEADFALAQFAAALGDDADAKVLLARAQSWRNVFNPANAFFDPKLLDHSFLAATSLMSTQGMTEGTASQYRWVLPFNHQALLTAMGGPDAVNPRLDAFFPEPNDFDLWNEFYSTNEFGLGVAYWYNYTGQPWKTQALVNHHFRTEMTQLNKNGYMWITMNDDLGAMSAVMVWSMLGFYPEYPGSGILVINGPEFPSEVIRLPSGNAITVHGVGASQGAPYIQSLQVNGQPSTKLWLDPSVLDKGVTLDFAMGSSPNTGWGSGAADAPPSYGVEETAAIGFVSGSSPIVLAPSATADAGIGVQSTRADVSQSISWQIGADGGAGVAQSSGQIALVPGGRGASPITVTAPASEGTYPVTVQLTSSLDAAVPALVLPVIVAKPGTLWPYFNNAGISDDAHTGAGNFDGVGFSYSAQALAAAGATPGSAISAGGFTFHWPSVPSGKLDNIVASGQTIQLGTSAGKTSLGLLGSATNAGSPSGATGTLTITYGDGTSQQATIAFSDWTLGAGSLPPVAGNTIALSCNYRNAGDNTKTYVFSLATSLTSSQPVTSITLPPLGTGGQIHIFDIALN
jgi:predicted alpha-1,2-mannosidase